MREVVNRLFDAVEAKGGEAEIIGDLAAPLPAMMIGRLLGFDDDRWPDLQSWSERTIVLGGGPRYFTEDGMIAAMEFAQASADLYEAKQALPGRRRDVGVDAGRDRRRARSPVEAVISDCLLILDGGAETTRTVIARTLLNLIERPDVWQAPARTAPTSTVATEEFIRFVTPIHNMCRVATRRLRHRRRDGPRRAAGRADVLVGQPRRARTSPTPTASTCRRDPNNHLVVRLRHALLPRRVAGPARDPGLLRGARPPRAATSGSSPAPRSSRCRTRSSTASSRPGSPSTSRRSSTTVGIVLASAEPSIDRDNDEGQLRAHEPDMRTAYIARYRVGSGACARNRPSPVDRPGADRR